MAPEIQLVVFSTLLSLAIAYAWWVRLRVWMLRQDLFSIRDQLWETMLDQGTLDDPDHRRVREEINAMIRIAPLFSVWTLISIAIGIVIEGKKLDFLANRCTSQIIQEARDQFIRRSTRYLLFETLTGLVVVLVFVVVIVRVGHPLRVAIEKCMAVTGRIYGSLQIREESREIGEIASSALSNI